MRSILRAPRLLLQLLLLALIAGLIGGTGLVGLRNTQESLRAVTTTQMPGLAALLRSERDVEQANFAGASALLDSRSALHQQADLAQLGRLSAQAWQDFQQFEAITAQSGQEQRVPPDLLNQTRALFVRWHALAGQARQLIAQPALLHATATVQSFNAATAATATPLVQRIDRLVQVQLAGATHARSRADAVAANATILLLVVIAVAVLAAGIFQSLMAIREHRRRALVQQSGDLVLMFDAEGVVRFASPSHERLLGYPPAMLLNRPVRAYLHPEDRAEADALWARSLEEPGTSSATEVRFRHADGSYRWLAATAANHLLDPLVRGMVITSRDVTKRKDAAERLAFQASHDALTGLPNRYRLQDCLQEALAADHGHSPQGALLLLDLNRFKEINDTLGHAVGDRLLQEAGRRLAATVRAADLAARLGGDEFGILLPGTSARTAQELAGRILRALEAPFAIAGQTLEVGASIGIAQYPEHGHDPQLLLQRADVAMYAAKHDHADVAVYREEQDQHSVHRLALTRELRQGLQEQQLVLHYQPKIDLATGGVEGVEALIRWRHPTRGLIPPDTFIPLAEQNGLIGQLTTWVLETALAQCRAWQIAGTPLAVAVNLSARTLQDPQLPDLVERLLVHHTLAGNNLTLEITESSLIGDPDRAREVLRRLHALGIQISIDDFGTGYSSLGYLKDLPVDEVKIDRSFVRRLYGVLESTDVPLVRSIIALAHALHLRVVAEGVEDAQTQAILADLCCDAVQGYLISRPVPADELDLWLQTLHAASNLATPGRRCAAQNQLCTSLDTPSSHNPRRGLWEDGSSLDESSSVRPSGANR